jgi:hypothetical protein
MPETLLVSFLINDNELSLELQQYSIQNVSLHLLYPWAQPKFLQVGDSQKLAYKLIFKPFILFLPIALQYSG